MSPPYFVPSAIELSVIPNSLDLFLHNFYFRMNFNIHILFGLYWTILLFIYFEERSTIMDNTMALTKRSDDILSGNSFKNWKEVICIMMSHTGLHLVIS